MGVFVYLTTFCFKQGFAEDKVGKSGIVSTMERNSDYQDSEEDALNGDGGDSSTDGRLEGDDILLKARQTLHQRPIGIPMAKTTSGNGGVSRTSWKRVAERKNPQSRSQSLTAAVRRRSSTDSNGWLNSSITAGYGSSGSSSSSGDDIYFEQWTEDRKVQANGRESKRRSDVIREEYHERVLKSSDIFPSNNQIYVQSPFRQPIEMTPSECCLYSDVIKHYDDLAQRKSPLDPDLENMRIRILQSSQLPTYSSSQASSDQTQDNIVRKEERHEFTNKKNEKTSTLHRTFTPSRNRTVIEEEEEEHRRVYETTTTTTLTTTTTTVSKVESQASVGAPHGNDREIHFYPIPIHVNPSKRNKERSTESPKHRTAFRPNNSPIGFKFKNVTLHKIGDPL
ncbi:hypothetical protein ACOME3_007732 [Neoechinorhynchus agilis]